MIGNRTMIGAWGTQAGAHHVSQTTFEGQYWEHQPPMTTINDEFSVGPAGGYVKWHDLLSFGENDTGVEINRRRDTKERKIW